MTHCPQTMSRLVDRLQRCLPLPATPKPALRAYLRRAVPETAKTSRCRVTSVFYADKVRGLMCQFVVEASATPHIFVAPLAQIAFDHRHPIAGEITAHQKHRFQPRR